MKCAHAHSVTSNIVGTDRSVIGNDQSILGSIVIGVKRSTLASSINCLGCWNQDSSINRSIVGTDPRPSNRSED